MANPRRSDTGRTTSEAPRPRQVMASKPSTAQRTGTACVNVCSQAGNRNDGTQPPPSITEINTTKIAMRRVASGVRPSAAINRPNVDAMIAHATATARKPGRLAIRTSNTTRAKRNDVSSVISVRMVPLIALATSSVLRDSGALRSRFHSPRWRSSRMPTASSMAAKSANCTLIPAKACP